jgi:hypothetical protein
LWIDRIVLAATKEGHVGLVKKGGR